MSPGARLGTYEILSALGAGGMGEVYRARDSELRRDVAIKVLPASVASDPDRLARLRREAQVLTSLNDPTSLRATLLIQGREEKSPTPAVAESVIRAGGVDVSPDGRWMAYQSPASGEFQVYVDALRGLGPRFQISTRGGGSPVWRGDGGELYYAEPTAKAVPGQLQPGSAEIRMMAVTVATQPTL